MKLCEKAERKVIEIAAYEELDDIIYGFIKTANYFIGAECINGYIELKNRNSYKD